MQGTQERRGIFNNPLGNKTEQQMEKLRKAMEKEQEMDRKVEEIVQANRRD